MSRRTAQLIVATAILLTLAGTADACPVCFSAKDGTRHAFYLTTALLTVLPMMLISGIGFGVFRYLNPPLPEVDGLDGESVEA
jgi:hypothetical protein